MRWLTILFTTVLFIAGSRQSYAQQPINISLFPGYHITDTNDYSSMGRASIISYIIGSTISTRRGFMGFPMEVSLGYSWGSSTLYTYNTKPEGYYIPFKFDIRYQTIPVEALYIHHINENVELMGGFNISGQYRKFFLKNGTNMKNEHLFSFGIGLTGKIQSILKELKNGKGAIFGNLTARWTEFIFHNANSDNLGYALRQVTMTPKIGLTLNLD